MKKYVELQMAVRYLANVDIITYSNGNDNDIEDDNWFED